MNSHGSLRYSGYSQVWGRMAKEPGEGMVKLSDLLGHPDSTTTSRPIPPAKSMYFRWTCGGACMT